jgi:hypothetical protein
MQPVDILQGIYQVLTSPAWNGLAGIAALTSIPLSVFLARRKTLHPQSHPRLPLHLKKV